MPEAIPYLFRVMCLMGALLSWLTLKLNRTIRGAYAGRWPELREPSILTANLRDSLAMQRWLYRRDYVSSGNLKLIKLCDTIRISSGIYLAVFAATVAAMLWSLSSIS